MVSLAFTGSIRWMIKVCVSSALDLSFRELF
jgi:hypothetical protein